jgi:zinc and cadmium transporter
MNTDSLTPAICLGFYCLLIILASLAGGWLLLYLRLSHTRLQLVISFVAGLMLGIALLHFIPYAYHQSHALDRTVQWALGGFLAMFFMQRFLPHHHHDVPHHPPENHHHCACSHKQTPCATGHPAHRLAWVATTAGMTLHSLLDGIALAAAVATESSGHNGIVALGAALVIILHKPFDAIAVSTLMETSGCSRAMRQFFNTLFALVTPLGAALVFLGASQFTRNNPAMLSCALAFCAGTFLCIASADLLPELQFHSHDRIKLSLALLLGIAVSVAIGAVEESGHDHHHEGEHHHEHEVSKIPNPGNPALAAPLLFLGQSGRWSKLS